MAMISNLKPYKEMNPVEVMTHWKRVRYQHCLNLYESPNQVLWAIVDEAKGVTLQMWDTNTGSIIKQQAVELKQNPGMTTFVISDAPMPPSPLRPIKVAICRNCGHEIRWQRVAVPPRWEHVRGGFSGGTNWICGCGCMKAEPKETES